MEVEDRCGDNNDYTAGFAKETNHFKGLKILEQRRVAEGGREKKKSLSWGQASKAPVTQDTHCPFGLDCSFVKWVLSQFKVEILPERKLQKTHRMYL